MKSGIVLTPAWAGDGVTLSILRKKTCVSSSTVSKDVVSCENVFIVLPYGVMVMSHAGRSRFARTYRPEITHLEERTLPAIIANLAQPHQLDSILVRFNTPSLAESFDPGTVLSGVSISKELAPHLVPGLRTFSFDPAQYSV